MIGSLVCMGVTYVRAQDEPVDPGTASFFMPQDGEKMPEYAPGEVLVKFTEGVDPGTVLQEVGLEAEGIERVHSIKNVVNKFLKKEGLEKDKDGWYWFRGKQYKEVDNITDNEIFQETYKEMSPARQGLYRTYKVGLAEGLSVEEAVRQLEQNPEIEYAEPNYIVSINLEPNDPLYPIQWSLHNIGQDYPASGNYNAPPGTPDCDIDTPAAWDITTGSDEIIVAVIDTGADYTHPDLWDNIWVNPDVVPDTNGDGNIDLNDCDLNGNHQIEPDEIADNMFGWDFANNDNDPMDDNGHGTHCAGIIAAETDNNIDIAGVAWNAKIMALKFLDSDGSGNTSDAAAAIRYAATNGAKVMSNSWGSGRYSQTLEIAILR